MSSERFRVVVAVDGSEAAEEVLEQALDQASRHPRAIVHVLRVIESRREPPTSAVEEAKREVWELVKEKLEDFGWGTTPDFDWQVRLHVRAGDVVEEIVGLTYEVEPELVVMGPGSRRGLLGTTTDKVTRQVPTSVMITRVPYYGEKEEEVEQCPACVVVREQSEGERWFCDDHARQGTLGTATLLLSGPVLGLGHGPMW